MLFQVGEHLQHARTVAYGLAHADDAAAADVHAGFAHGFERVEAVLELPRGDDLAVELGRGVDVVVVVVEPGVAQFLGLLARQHAERRAALHAEGLHLADHRRHHLDVALLGRAPRGAHAEARRAGFARGLGARGDIRDGHQRLALEARVVADALRAVRAVLGAGAGLDRQQRAHLHGVRRLVLPVHPLRLEQQVLEGQREQRLDLLERPVVAGGCGHGRVLIHFYAFRRDPSRARRGATAAWWAGEGRVST